jgi:hypothetical protein
MTPTERAHFEAMIESDPVIREELILRKDIIVGIKAAEREILKQKLDRAAEGKVALKPHQHVNALWRRYRWWIVGGLIAAAAVLYLALR